MGRGGRDLRLIYNGRHQAGQKQCLQVSWLNPAIASAGNGVNLRVVPHPGELEANFVAVILQIR